MSIKIDDDQVTYMAYDLVAMFMDDRYSETAKVGALFEFLEAYVQKAVPKILDLDIERVQILTNRLDYED